MSSNDLSLNNIAYQDPLRSKPIRENHRSIQTEYNALRAEVNEGIASTASEITSARQNFTTLSDNIEERKIYGCGIFTGGLITPQGTADNTLHVSAGHGIVADGRGVNFTAADSSAISVVLKPRWVVAVANADNSVSMEYGNTGDDPELPDLLSSQLPLALIYQNTASPFVATAGVIWDARSQGCMLNQHYYFKIQDAIDAMSGTIGGDLRIGAGKYIEDVDIISKNQFKVTANQGAKILRPDDSSNSLRIATCSDFSWNGGQLQGNDKTGDYSLMQIVNSDTFVMSNIIFDDNKSASATDKHFLIGTCTDFRMDGLMLINSAGTATDNEYQINNSNNYILTSPTRTIRDGFDTYDEMKILIEEYQ